MMQNSHCRDYHNKKSKTGTPRTVNGFMILFGIGIQDNDSDLIVVIQTLAFSTMNDRRDG